jgi:pimeloyl-ACP methyl ester carboxylesterase
VAFVAEFLSGGRHRVLSALADDVVAQPLAVPGAAVDVIRRSGHGRGVPLVLVHGVTENGKDDPRLRAAAALLARTGFDVAVPTVPGLTRGRLRPDDVEPVVATIAQRSWPTTVVAVSIGSGPAILAAADPRVRERVTTVVTLGGYASGRELARFFLTGEYAYGDLRGRATHDPRLVAMFLEANADVLGAEARRDIESLDPERRARAVRELSPDVVRMLDALSPERVVRQLSARLLLIHGRTDAAVPYTESLRLAAAARPDTIVSLLGVIEHVEGTPRPEFGRALRELTLLWRIAYVMIAEREVRRTSGLLARAARHQLGDSLAAAN